MPTYEEWETQTLAPAWLRGTWGARLLDPLSNAQGTGAFQCLIGRDGVEGMQPPVV